MMYLWMQVLAMVLMAIVQVTLGWGHASPELCVAAGFLVAWVPMSIVVIVAIRREQRRT